jgi:hypothetical protein
MPSFRTLGLQAGEHVSEQATDGAVTANDMLAGLQPKRRAA